MECMPEFRCTRQLRQLNLARWGSENRRRIRIAVERLLLSGSRSHFTISKLHGVLFHYSRIKKSFNAFAFAESVCYIQKIEKGS